MPAPFSLTEGAIAMMSSGEVLGIEPVLQVANIKLVNTRNLNENTERYLVLFSDGTFLQQGMLSTKPNELALSKKLQTGSIVRLKDFICTEIRNRIIVIVIEMDVIFEKCDPIGEPRQYPGRADSSASLSINQPAAATVNHRVNSHSQILTIVSKPKMPAPFSLTKGAIAMISSGKVLGIEPVLQVASIHIVKAPERYRVVLSDGSFWQQGMLTTIYNELARSEKLQTGSIVRLKQFTCREIQNRMIVIVLELDVIFEKCDPIGEPRQYPGGTDSSASSSINQPAAAGNHPSYGARTASVPP